LVSHDLRAPLRAIDGFSQVLRDEHAGPMNDEGRRLLGSVQRNAAHMKELLDGLLIFAKLGFKPLEKIDVELDPLVHAIVGELQMANPSRHIEWHIEPLGKVAGDPLLLRQVFYNLLANAAKFTRGRSPAVIDVTRTEQPDRIVFAVRDNGAGFDSQYAERLFAVFQRLHTQQEFEGTGVGLAIVQRVVQRHGGTVWAESRLGEGATFYVALPPDGSTALLKSKEG
jgi:light-regulated signal transduction histidine kinase (bacteriophytochrome)